MTVKELMLSNLVIGDVRLVNNIEPTNIMLTEIITDHNWSPMKDYFDMQVIGIQANCETKKSEYGWLTHYWIDILIEAD